MSKPKVAFFDFASCEGCQLTVVDALQTYPDLLGAVEIVNFREASSRREDDYLIAFVEGSVTREQDEPRMRHIREHAAGLVALGAFDNNGCVNELQNLQPLDDVRLSFYWDKDEWSPTYAVRPISAVVQVDAVIPGCPIDRDEFIKVVRALLVGKKPPVPDYPVCVECKLKGNVCMFHIGKTCLGPVTRAGCGAACPTYGDGCEGCRGFIPNPNENAMKDVLDEAGLTVEEIMAQMTMFNAYFVPEKEA